MILDLASKFWKLLPPEVRSYITRRLQPKFTSSVAAVVTNEAGEVLLLDHLLRPKSGWGLPGGFVERGEQPEAALRRELREETGIELRDMTLFRCRNFDRHIEIIFLAKNVGEPLVKSREIKRLAWFAADDLPPEMNLDQQFLIQNAMERGTEN